MSQKVGKGIWTSEKVTSNKLKAPLDVPFVFQLTMKVKTSLELDLFDSRAYNEGHNVVAPLVTLSSASFATNEVKIHQRFERIAILTLNRSFDFFKYIAWATRLSII